MDRRTFTKSCFFSFSCAIASPLLYSCQSNYYTAGMLEPNGLSVAKSEFSFLKKDKPMIRQYVIVRNEKLEFPIYLYRFSENEYSAVLMKCTHQGNELQASGDHLHCSAHGSEYTSKGIVAQGPAEKNLRSFKVSSDNEKIFIDLRS
jgi:Rieske Fe-S protein